MKKLTETAEPPAPLNNSLPWQAFAIAPDKSDPLSWQLPHHTREVRRAVSGKIGIEHTVDWLLLEKAALLLSRYGDEGKRGKNQGGQGEIKGRDSLPAVQRVKGKIAVDGKDLAHTGQ